ncbi:MAG: zinc-dependent peptidase [Gammaproteobacteria bacterium]
MDSTAIYYWLIVIGIPLAVYFFRKWLKESKRRKLYRNDFPQEWKQILTNHFKLYQHLPDDLKKQLHGHINIFLDEKNFVGYQGIEINDTIRITIAAQACLLLLNRKTNYYPHLTNILVYPTVFTHKNHDGELHRGRFGESWHRGPIVLSWQHSSQGGKNNTDGENVVMHEFAHQLDQVNGPSDGLPILQHNNIKQWSSVLGKEFKTLKFKIQKREQTLLDEYGATNPAEFFAVITEHFVEQPRQMLKKHPELYEELRKYYQINPVEWT